MNKDLWQRLNLNKNKNCCFSNRKPQNLFTVVKHNSHLKVYLSMVTFLNIHTHDPKLDPKVQSVLSLSVGHDDLSPMENQPVAIGVHPWFINVEAIDVDLERVHDLAKLRQVKMIGECGLDKVKGAPFETQLVVFEKQMWLAKEFRKPLILHCVRAYDELLAMAKRIDPQVAMIIHGFNKSEQLGRQLMEHGFTLSFGKALLKEDSGAVAIVKGGENFLLETDDSEHTIQQIYDAAANIKKMTIDELKALIFANWKTLNLI